LAMVIELFVLEVGEVGRGGLVILDGCVGR
jgi:hypothetical protein